MQGNILMEKNSRGQKTKLNSSELQVNKLEIGRPVDSSCDL